VTSAWGTSWGSSWCSSWGTTATISGLTSAVVSLDRIVGYFRDPRVATAAGIAAGTWADAVTPRVFRGNAALINGRNRGRFPFVELRISGQKYKQEHYEGGTLTMELTAVAYCAGGNLEVAGNLLDGILIAGLNGVRSGITDNLTSLGNDRIGPLIPSPQGHRKEAKSTISVTYERATYEVS
jgi:hypothetical protein